MWRMGRAHELGLEHRGLVFGRHMDQEYGHWRMGLLIGPRVRMGQVYGRCLRMDQACGFGVGIDAADSNMGHYSRFERMILHTDLVRCCLQISTFPKM